MFDYSVEEISKSLNGELFGNPSLRVSGLANIDSAESNQLVIAINDQYRKQLKKSKALVAILAEPSGWEELELESAIVLPNPRMGLALSTKLFQPEFDFPIGIHASSFVSPSATIGEESIIGPFCFIGDNVVIKAGAKIANHVSIHSNTVIGKDCFIHSGVQIGSNITIGEQFICNANTVIGCDGFSFETEQKGAVDDVKETLGSGVRNSQSNYHKIYSLGTVSIGDEVEIGACVAIDRGTLSATSIGKGTKIDNLVHIAHNVQIGEDCLICGQVGIAGSAKLGNRVVLGGQVGVKDHILIGDDVVAGGASKIFTNVQHGKIIMGSPAVEMTKNIAIYKASRKLPKLVERVDSLELRLKNSELNLEK